jgi:hypothetical protein
MKFLLVLVLLLLCFSCVTRSMQDDDKDKNADKGTNQDKGTPQKHGSRKRPPAEAETESSSSSENDEGGNGNGNVPEKPSPVLNRLIPLMAAPPGRAGPGVKCPPPSDGPWGMAATGSIVRRIIDECATASATGSSASTGSSATGSTAAASGPWPGQHAFADGPGALWTLREWEHIEASYWKGRFDAFMIILNNLNAGRALYRF